ncbi:MAG: hypothetical protein IMZ66_04670 [Planctomycetes bacterium]|nr:hypothetical protein [Planctomycetota bacterium]
MEITGRWDPKMDIVLKHLFKIAKDLEDGIKAMPSAAVRDASSTLYSNVSAVSSTLYKLCKDTRTHCSSQAVESLLRTIIEASTAVFAFCGDPPSRAVLFMNYACVIKLRLHIDYMRNTGCPFLPASRYSPAKVALAKARAKKDLLRYGAAYLKKDPGKGKAANDAILAATKEGSEHLGRFRDHWFPGSRQQILACEQMEWVHDVLYKPLCSSVHSDVKAGSLLGGSARSTAAFFALQFWGASVLRLSEALGVSLGESHAKFLRDRFYAPLQWKPGKPGATVV